jgi:hypothetical protein
MVPRLARTLLLLALALPIAHTASSAAQGVAAPLPPSTAQERGRELLNSERIAQRFGSYGIDVLESDGRVRVSNLYSEHSGERICRTFAVVRYADTIAPAIAGEHAEIVAGGSIGAVFTSHGWRVEKKNLRYFAMDAPARVAALMHVAKGTRLAAHAYALDVVREGQSFAYALLVEIHHPDYLRLDDLQAIYGPADSAGREAAVASLIATATEKADQDAAP